MLNIQKRSLLFGAGASLAAFVGNGAMASAATTLEQNPRE